MKVFNNCRFFLCFLLPAAGISSLQAQDSYYQLEVKDISAKEIKFINKSNLEVKVILYRDGDNVMAVGLKSLTIKAGKSATYKYGVYNVKIFKPQVFDKILFTQKNVSGNLEMSGTENNFKARRLSSRKNTEFRNNTGREIKICLYKRNDNVKAIPFATYVLRDNTSTASYNGDETSFFVSVFEPELLDKLVVSQICPYQSVITVKKVR